MHKYGGLQAKWCVKGDFSVWVSVSLLLSLSRVFVSLQRLLLRLLDKDSRTRLSLPMAARSAFFSSFFSFPKNCLYGHAAKPPFIPSLKGPFDCAAFDSYPESTDESPQLTAGRAWGMLMRACSCRIRYAAQSLCCSADCSWKLKLGCCL